MAPEWTWAARPLVLIDTAVAFAVTAIFRASVDAQGGTYATGVLVMMTSAALAVALPARRRGRPRGEALGFAAITALFAYTTVVNVLERPDGVEIAACFIGAIVLVSLVSRLWRTLELRAERIEVVGYEDPTPAASRCTAPTGTCVHPGPAGGRRSPSSKGTDPSDRQAWPASRPDRASPAHSRGTR